MGEEETKKADEKKPDFVLSDGREITFDLEKVTLGQWMGLFDPKESDERSDHTVARASGLTNKEISKLSLLEYKRLMDAFRKKCREPLADPN